VLALAAAACADRANPAAPVPREAPTAPSLLLTPVRRTWTGATSTDWHTAANWSGGVVPAATDTAVVPAAVSNFPALAANVSIGGVEVGDAPARIDLGAFDLTATGDVTTGTLGGMVTGTVGRMILAGTARTVVGSFPRVRVTGTYSLNGNLTVNHNLRVEAGRLRSTGFLIRVDNP
jgi:hypothetical protein